MSHDTSLREWFASFTAKTGEIPHTIVFKWGSWCEREDWPPLPTGLTPFPQVASEVLDHKFSDGFGGNDSPNLCAWSDNWVLFSDNYDGAEDLQWVPRHPLEHDPIRPGGG